MRTYNIRYCNDDSATLKEFLCEASTYDDAIDQLLETIPNVYYYEFDEVC